MAADDSGMYFIRLAHVLVLFAFPLIACNSEPHGSTPGTAYRIEGTCTEFPSWCDDEFAECTERGAQACRTCYEVGGFGCSAYCDYRPDCMRWHCGQSRGCLEWSHTATLGEPDPAIREACESASVRNLACGDDPYPTGGCDLFAATEYAQAAAIYECIATAPCGEEASCIDIDPDEDVSRLACEAMTACDLNWDACEDGFFAEWLGWLRHDVKTGLLQCAGLVDCVERLSCFKGWLQSVDPQQ